jgi:ABC-2 type transport system ATP-binding protein
LLERFGLSDRSSVPLGYYSRGMKQKVGLARALINEPRILFLDEPTLGLDPRGQQEIRRIILELHEKDVTVFLSSHALSEVSSICERVAIVNKGRLVAEGTLRELREHAGDKGTILVRVTNSDRTEQQLSHLPFQVDVRRQGDYLDVTVPASAIDFIHSFQKAGVEIYEIHRNDMTLEQVFFNLTEAASTHAVASLPVKGEPT